MAYLSRQQVAAPVGVQTARRMNLGDYRGHGVHTLLRSVRADSFPRSWMVLLALRHRQKRTALPPRVDRCGGRPLSIPRFGRNALSNAAYLR